MVDLAEKALKEIVYDHFPKKEDGSDKLFRVMVKKLLPKLRNTPASANAKYHGAWCGGLLVHTVAVIQAGLNVADTFREDIEKDDEGALAMFKKCVVVACFLHDIGKVGNLAHPYYLEQDNDWRADNLGEMFVINRDTNLLPYLPVPVRSLWIAQQFDISLTEEEVQAIVASDGPQTAHGKQVVSTFLEEPLTMVVHFADVWVSQVRGI
jgi:hypothetical protein